MYDSDYFRRAQADLDAYLREPDDLSRQKRAPYDVKLLKDSQIEEVLGAGFERYCAYCETDMSEFEFFDVEHHRPKSGAADYRGKTDFLHYAWLAYDWENLLPICRTCNVAKKNKFFVAGPRGPVGAPVAQLRKMESELQIDPCFHNIAEHLSFTPSGFADAQSDIGQGTIDILDLNRIKLVRARATEFLTVSNTLSQNTQLGVVPTGQAVGWGSSIVAWPDGKRIQHAGSTTLALLKYASRTMPNLANFADFLARWRDLSNDEQARFCDIFDEEAHVDTVAAASPREASHQTRLRDLPTAERPISRLRIRNFKGVTALDVSLKPSLVSADMIPCMLLLGENATGKSTVLEAICLTLIGTRECRALDALISDEAIRPAEFVHRQSFDKPELADQLPLLVEIDFYGDTRSAKLTGDPGAIAFGGSEQPSKIVIGYGPRRYFPNKSTRRFRGPANRARSLFDPMASISNPVSWLQELGRTNPPQFDAAVRALRIVLMLDEQALVIADGAQIMIETAGRRTPLTKLSVGYKSVLAMVIDIIRELFIHYDNLENAYACVLIDEIETHLHPRWKMRIVELLRRAFPRVQFIMTTHDPLCLRGMGSGEVQVMARGSDNQIGLIPDLPDVSGMRIDQILTSEHFGMHSTLDPDFQERFDRYYKLLREAQSRPGLEAEVEKLRIEINSCQRIGQTEREQRMLEAIDRYIATRVTTLPEREQQDQALEAELDSIWNDAKANLA